MNKAWTWDGIPNNAFLVGIESNFFKDNLDNGDRKFNLFYADATSWELKECQEKKLNSYDKNFNLVLNGNEVISKVRTTYSTSFDDREYFITICILKKAPATTTTPPPATTSTTTTTTTTTSRVA